MTKVQIPFTQRLTVLLEQELDQWGLQGAERLDAQIGIQEKLFEECFDLYLKQAEYGVVLEEAIPRLAMKLLSQKWAH